MLLSTESWELHYRAIAFKREDTLHMRSRNNMDFSARYPAVMKALAKLPPDTVIDGEIVAFDDDGRPSFNALQNSGSAPALGAGREDRMSHVPLRRLAAL